MKHLTLLKICFSKRAKKVYVISLHDTIISKLLLLTYSDNIIISDLPQSLTHLQVYQVRCIGINEKSLPLLKSLVLENSEPALGFDFNKLCPNLQLLVIKNVKYDDLEHYMWSTLCKCNQLSDIHIYIQPGHETAVQHNRFTKMFSSTLVSIFKS